MNTTIRIDESLKNLVPPQRSDEHSLLEESILKNGFDSAYPLITWNGILIDGHNRYEICREHGISYTTTEKTFDDRSDVINWIIDNQLSRRNLTGEQKEYLIGKRQIEEKKAAHRPIQENKGDTVTPLKTAEVIAKQSNVSPRTVYRAAKFAESVDTVSQNTGINPQKILSGEIQATRKDIRQVSKLEPEVQKRVLEKVENKEVKTVKDAVKEVEKDIIEEKKDSIVLPETTNLINSDFRDANLERDSIDFIITDPPYPNEYLPLYEDLAKMANSVLKDGGSLIMMVGQSYLPEIINITIPYLKYHWTLGYITSGGQSPQLWTKKVNTFWKPILWFTKGEYKGGWVGDVIKSDNNDKRFHDWGQSESGMYNLMERFVMPGDVILDPFMGGGTTGVICKELKCEFIGIEKEIATFNTAKVRLGE
jgi:site-specific DNA-methyltransferase (adenine-specific)